MRLNGASFGLVGALRAVPRRLAARDLARSGAQLRRGLTRQTTHVVFGHRLLDTTADAEIATRRQAARDRGAILLSENALLRLLGSAPSDPHAAMSREALLGQSGLDGTTLDLLALFDAFEHDAGPFSFRDLILARKYAGLVAMGANWGAIARSIHRSGPVASLTALSLHVDGPEQIYARHGDGLTELDGQHLLALDAPDEAAADDLFYAAEAAEIGHDHAEAAALYARCLALDPTDSVAAYNRANCLRELGEADAAAHGYAAAIKLDPRFVEAWFNCAGVLRAAGHLGAARTHLNRAIAIDPGYADAVYNLATLDYEEGDLAAARAGWSRYLELDHLSHWARRAERGIRYVDLALRQSAG